MSSLLNPTPPGPTCGLSTTVMATLCTTKAAPSTPFARCVSPPQRPAIPAQLGVARDGPTRGRLTTAGGGAGSLLSSSTLRVTLSASNTSYELHRDLLARHSPYFASLLSFPGTEAASGAVTLSEPCDTDDAFQAFVEFLYRGGYASSALTDFAAAALLHVRVYLLADRLCTDALKEYALRKTIKTLCASYSDTSEISPAMLVSLVELVYANTPDHHHHHTLEEPEEREEPEDELLGGGDMCKGCKHNSKDEKDEKEESDINLPGFPALPPPRPGKDPMRMLFARYSLSRFSALKKSAQFVALLQDAGEFMLDVFEQVGDRTQLSERMELSYLLPASHTTSATKKTRRAKVCARKRVRKSWESDSESDTDSLSYDEYDSYSIDVDSHCISGIYPNY